MRGSSSIGTGGVQEQNRAILLRGLGNHAILLRGLGGVQEHNHAALLRGLGGVQEQNRACHTGRRGTSTPGDTGHRGMTSTLLHRALRRRYQLSLTLPHRATMNKQTPR